jgi:hypothetical protein
VSAALHAGHLQIAQVAVAEPAVSGPAVRCGHHVGLLGAAQLDGAETFGVFMLLRLIQDR